MGRIVALALVALALPASAEAKFRLTLAVSDPAPPVGEDVRVAVRADVSPDDAGTLRLVAVPPGTDLYAALQEEGRYRVRLARGADGWSATVRFPRAGRWLLVVPNWGAPGYAIPPPVVEAVDVAAPEAAGGTIVPWLALAGGGVLLAVALVRRVRPGGTLAVALVALALPATADAKEITGLAVCGPLGCEEAEVAGWGHRSPMDSALAVPPRAGPYYEVRFVFGGHESASPVWYEPRSGLAAFPGNRFWLTWTRFDPQLAPIVEEAARHVEPFPAPPVSEVKIGERTVTRDAASYLQLFALGGERALPREGARDVIRFVSPVESPWTARILVYYPEDDVLVLGSGTYVEVPADVAADIEAARPLGSGEPTVIPWVAVAIACGGALLLLALGAAGTRRRLADVPGT